MRRILATLGGVVTAGAISAVLALPAQAASGTFAGCNGTVAEVLNAGQADLDVDAKSTPRRAEQHAQSGERQVLPPARKRQHPQRHGLGRRAVHGSRVQRER
jgi:hypothetical protein